LFIDFSIKKTERKSERAKIDKQATTKNDEYLHHHLITALKQHRQTAKVAAAAARCCRNPVVKCI